jgi:hypothetical protein
VPGRHGGRISPHIEMDEIAFDPPVSEAQRRAMWAAKEGRSSLGIPQKVGAEFVGRHGGRASEKAGDRDFPSDGRVAREADDKVKMARDKLPRLAFYRAGMAFELIQ